MTEDEVAARFVTAARVERTIPKRGEKPQSGGSSMPAYIHTYEDKLGWRNMPSERGNQLLPGEDPLSQERERFWRGRSGIASSLQVSEWEECIRWTVELVTDDDRRRALWGWAQSKAGGDAFDDWCADAGISRKTGYKRKNSAVIQIASALRGKPLQNNDLPDQAGLHDTPGFEHIPATVGEGSRQAPREYTWRDDEALKASDGFSWSRSRKDARRRRAANG